jgi:hypothetical protein
MNPELADRVRGWSGARAKKEVSHKSLKGHVCLFMVLLWTLAAARSFAGSVVIGSVAGSKNATIDGQVVLPNTTIVSSESLQVNDGAAVVAI